MEVQPRIISAEAVLSGFETKFPLNFLGPMPRSHAVTAECLEPVDIMPIVWRVTKPEGARVLHGGETRERGGRWNSPGWAVLYASENLALAALECLANLPINKRQELREMAAVGIEIPDGPALCLERHELEPHWIGSGGELWCRSIGDRWLEERSHLILSAPSVIVPRERNVMLNPAHPNINNVRIAVVEPYRYDPRLVAGTD